MSRKGNPSISFRVSKELKRALEDEADAQSMDFSSYVREALSNRSDSQFNHKATLERIQQKNEKLQVQNKRLQEELNSGSSSDFEMQKQQIEQRYESQIAELQNQLQEQLEAGSGDDITKVKQDYEETIDDLNRQIEQLESTVDTTAETVGIAYSEKISLLTEQLDELKTASENDTHLIEELREQISNSEVNEEEKLLIDDLSTQLEETQQELDDTVKQLTITDKKLANAAELHQSNVEEINLLTENYHQLEEESEGYKAEIDKFQNVNSEFENECQDLQEKLDDMTQEVQRLKRQAFMAEDEIKVLKKFSNKEQVTELQKNVASLEKEKEELAEDRLDLYTKRTAALRWNETLEKEKEDLQERIENLEIELTNAKRKRSTDEENEDQKLLVEDLTEETTRYQQECKSKDELIERLMVLVEDKNAKVELLKSQLEEYEQEEDNEDDYEQEGGELDEGNIATIETLPVPSATEFNEAENELYSEYITALHVQYPEETIERLILACLEANRANEQGVLWTKTVKGGLKLLKSKI